MRTFRSKTYAPPRPLLLLLWCLLLGLTYSAEARAQTFRAQIRVVSVGPARIQIDLELPVATDALSFRNAYGGVLGLGERIERVAVSNDGRGVAVKKLAPGEYQAETKFNRISYDVSITEPRQAAQPHVSWLNGEHGLLMLADLLPRAPRASDNVVTIVRLEVPAGWSIASNLTSKDREYVTADPDKSVFLIGPLVRERRRQLGTMELSLMTSASWPFSDSDALKIAEKLIREYSLATGFTLKRNAVLMLLPFPGDVGPERWSAETRGNAVVLLLGRQAKPKRVLAQLGIVLSHEIFHLWVPNALALAGDYDWFFEGFTLYQALRMALRLELISFDTYLETIARVYDSYLASADVERLSLIEASERRWTTSSSLVYDKGMIVAFVYDLAARSATDCQASLDDIYKQLFRRYATGQGSANEIIIKALAEPTGRASFDPDYVAGTGTVALGAALSSYGIQLQMGSRGGKATKLGLAKDLNKLQRKRLRCLGYRG